jgi:hypothetical protein
LSPSLRIGTLLIAQGRKKFKWNKKLASNYSIKLWFKNYN